VSELKDMRKSIETILNDATDGDYSNYSEFFKECKAQILKIYQEATLHSYIDIHSGNIRTLFKVVGDNLNYAVAETALRRIVRLLEQLTGHIEND